MSEAASGASEMLVTLTSEIVAAHVSNNSVPVEEIPALIQKTYGALAALGSDVAASDEPLQPAVSIRSSVKPDHLVCLEDGKKMKMLKRHLMTHHGLTPNEYRERWGLSSDYPMCAPAYSAQRRTLAQSIGLGRKPGARSGRPKKPARAT